MVCNHHPYQSAPLSTTYTTVSNPCHPRETNQTTAAAAAELLPLATGGVAKPRFELGLAASRLRFRSAWATLLGSCGAEEHGSMVDHGG